GIGSGSRSQSDMLALALLTWIRRRREHYDEVVPSAAIAMFGLVAVLAVGMRVRGSASGRIGPARLSLGCVEEGASLPSGCGGQRGTRITALRAAQGGRRGNPGR